MRGRPADPNTNYRVRLHITHGQRYASTQPTVEDPETHVRKRTHVYWGHVDNNLVFTPNLRFKAATLEEQKKLIFPQEWDISSAFSSNENLKSCYKENNSCKEHHENSNLNQNAIESSTEEYENLLYGGGWLLTEIAKNLHIIDDIIDIFNDMDIVNDILSLAIFPILTNYNYDHFSQWQKYSWTPANHLLTSSYITRLTQKINDDNRMKFLSKRIERQNGETLVACDSTTRSAWGKNLADIRWGNNKDNKKLQNTVEVVVYSLDNHEPIYYRSFAGNESDIHTLRTIISDLMSLKCKDVFIIFDRGYESIENIKDLVLADLPFIMCSKTNQNAIYSKILNISWDNTGIPLNMEYCEKENVYCTQYEHILDITCENDTKKITLKINLFLDIKNRMQELVNINEKIKKEEKVINENPNKEIDGFKFDYYKLQNKNGKISYIKNTNKIEKAKKIAGFFSSISYKIDGDAINHLETYTRRDEQEKYFEIMKDQLGFNIQRNSSEDGKIGRLFILFISLILFCRVRWIWKQKLSDDFKSTFHVIHEMLPIRRSKYPDGTVNISGFTDNQIKISRAFDVEIPTRSMTERQIKSLDRIDNPKKRGRPRKTNCQEKS